MQFQLCDLNRVVRQQNHSDRSDNITLSFAYVRCCRLVKSLSMKSMPVGALLLLVATSANGAMNVESQFSTDAPEEQRVVVYEPDFFASYQPITALDMIQRVPGFQIREGGGARGFGGAPGNVLINGERPSSKSDSAANLLERISASQVEKIQLIRGQGGGLDLRGQSVAVNVMLKEDAGLSGRWSMDLEQDLDSGGPEPAGELSLTHQSGSTRYTSGLRIGRFFVGNPAVERLFDPDGLFENRFERERFKGRNGRFNLNTDRAMERLRVQTNLELQYQKRKFRDTSRRIPVDPQPPARLRILGEIAENYSIEAGGDAEYRWTSNLATKGIFLIRHGSNESFATSGQFDLDGGLENFGFSDSRREDSEVIVRAEIDWTGFRNHTVEFDLEAVFNRLDNELELMVDDGSGGVAVPVPGSNTRVEEWRGDVSVADSWQLASWLVETALAAEFSNLSQSGPEGQDRDFFFLKPSMTVTWSPRQSQQSRLRFEREVAQLNFFDFVSATNFGDDDLDLGNPDLSPQSAWVLELTQEQRFGDVGVAALTLFGNWIEDLQDLLPVTDRFEVPGNIGDGRRLGARFEGTLPLDVLALSGARIDVEMRWQDSRVTDPVTGQGRRFSDEREVTFELEFRQDLPGPRFSWGWELEKQSSLTRFGVDELDRFSRGVDLEAFIETSRWLGVKFTLTAENLLDRRFRRDRTVFDGRRGQSPLLFREDRDRRRGRSLILGVNGTF